MDLVDSIINGRVLARAVDRARERGVILPTFAELRNPALIPAAIRERLPGIGLQDLDPLNLFRITWKNEPLDRGGGYGRVNTLEIPPEISGVDARIVMLQGKWFPTGAHKVGAAYGCLAPRLAAGGFDPTTQKAVWPSTGNYCRGGAFDSHIMGCTAIAVLPEGMSRERFAWLARVGAEVIRTPGSESNVKEIYDKCREIRDTMPDAVIFNQFDEPGNAAWHYAVTGPAVDEAFAGLAGPRDRIAAWVSATGSAGTIAAGDYLRTRHPRLRVVAVEALQCPTLLANGYGVHRIEGIGDKHVPWIHNVRNTDAVAAVDDEDCVRVLRLFNAPQGVAVLERAGVRCASDLGSIGISGVANLLAAIKTARAFELTRCDMIFTVATDSAELYGSRLADLDAERGPYSLEQAGRDLDRCLHGQRPHAFAELTYADRRRIHNLKYFTWVEQQGKSVEDLERLWYDEDLWDRVFALPEVWDRLIKDFNRRAGLLA
jgi:cysteine synthase